MLFFFLRLTWWIEYGTLPYDRHTWSSTVRVHSRNRMLNCVGVPFTNNLHISYENVLFRRIKNANYLFWMIQHEIECVSAAFKHRYTDYAIIVWSMCSFFIFDLYSNEKIKAIIRVQCSSAEVFVDPKKLRPYSEASTKFYYYRSPNGDNKVEDKKMI